MVILTISNPRQSITTFKYTNKMHAQILTFLLFAVSTIKFCSAQFSTPLVCSCPGGSTGCGTVCCTEGAICVEASAGLCCPLGSSFCEGRCCAGVCFDGICCPKGTRAICDGVCCKGTCVVRRPPVGFCGKYPELCIPVAYCRVPIWDTTPETDQWRLQLTDESKILEESKNWQWQQLRISLVRASYR